MSIPRYFAIADHPHLLRDSTTMAIINTNRAGLCAVKKRKEIALNQLKKENEQKLEINNLRDEINEIKQLLTQLLDRFSEVR